MLEIAAFAPCCPATEAKSTEGHIFLETRIEEHTRSEPRRQRQKKRWFKKGQRWRCGCEGRISVLKRRHGLNRSRYRGPEGIERWVGLGVIADNLMSMGRVMATAAG